MTDPDSMATMRAGGAEHPDDPPLGRIDQYELVSKLGGGGFGVVYLARDTASGLDVALKTLHPLLKRDPEAMERLRGKFALASRLAHPGIATALTLHPVRDADVRDETARAELRLSPGDCVMVMRYAPGVTLSRWRLQFPGGVVPPDRVVDIARQLASALDYAHFEHIVHRDVKPGNVMVETQENGMVRVRLVDFGLAAEIRSSMVRLSAETGDTSGTRPYMAPEQWAGRKQDGRTDQYALACMLYELLSGEPPFAGVFETGDPAVMALAVEGRPPDLLAGLSSRANAAFARALAKTPDGRFPTCSAFVEALAAGLRARSSSEPSVPGVPLPSASAPPRRAPRRIVVALSAAVAAALLVVVGISLLSSRQSSVSVSDPDPTPVSVSDPDPTPVSVSVSDPDSTPDSDPAPSVPGPDATLSELVAAMLARLQDLAGTEAASAYAIKWDDKPCNERSAAIGNALSELASLEPSPESVSRAETLCSQVHEAFDWMKNNHESYTAFANRRKEAEAADAALSKDFSVPDLDEKGIAAARGALVKARDLGEKGEYANAKTACDGAVTLFGSARAMSEKRKEARQRLDAFRSEAGTEAASADAIKWDDKPCNERSAAIGNALSELASLEPSPESVSRAETLCSQVHEAFDWMKNNHESYTAFANRRKEAEAADAALSKDFSVPDLDEKGIAAARAALARAGDLGEKGEYANAKTACDGAVTLFAIARTTSENRKRDRLREEEERRKKAEEERRKKAEEERRKKALGIPKSGDTRTIRLRDRRDPSGGTIVNLVFTYDGTNWKSAIITQAQWLAVKEAAHDFSESGPDLPADFLSILDINNWLKTLAERPECAGWRFELGGKERQPGGSSSTAANARNLTSLIIKGIPPP